MGKYLSFEEVASILNCSTAKVRQMVVEDKTLKANRIHTNGMVVEVPVWDGYCVYGLDMNCHLSNEGTITSDIYRTDSTGNTVLSQTLDVGFLRIEQSDLDTFITDSSVNISNNEGVSSTNYDVDPCDLPQELDAGNMAFRAVTNGYGDQSATTRNRLIDYLKKHYPDFKEGQVERIATVANPDKSTGRKKSTKK